MRVLQALAALLAAAIFVAPAGAEALPTNFSDDLVVTVSLPTAIAFTPDGRMLVTTQGGALYAASGGVLGAAVLDLSSRICATSERGMLGVAVDPSFTSNRYVYVYYTVNKAGTCVNRTSRFVFPSTGSIDPATETVLLDNIPSPAGNHNAGDLNFGPDNLLYVSVGDGGCDYAGGGCGGTNDASRDRNVLLGKILRITRNGGVPLRNPFNHRGSYRCASGASPPGTVCRETYAWGFRNPFRFAFDPNTLSTRFFVNDVGQDTWEEIDQGQVGADYGWNVREGHCANGSTTDCGPPPAGMTNPIFDYSHAGGCYAITGGAFVPNGVWPGFDGAYIYADYGCGSLFRLDPNGSGGYASSGFVSGLGANSAVHLEFGPYGSTKALYYTTYAGGGQVRRISYHAAATPRIPGITTGPFGAW
jgi:glucose/arabinose dehydrogenase